MRTPALEKPVRLIWTHTGKCHCGRSSYLFSQCDKCAKEEMWERHRVAQEVAASASEEQFDDPDASDPAGLTGTVPDGDGSLPVESPPVGAVLVGSCRRFLSSGSVSLDEAAVRLCFQRGRAQWSDLESEGFSAQCCVVPWTPDTPVVFPALPPAASSYTLWAQSDQGGVYHVCGPLPAASAGAEPLVWGRSIQGLDLALGAQFYQTTLNRVWSRLSATKCPTAQDLESLYVRLEPYGEPISLKPPGGQLTVPLAECLTWTLLEHALDKIGPRLIECVRAASC